MADAKKVRAELKKRIQAVNNKINRIQKTTGAKVGGSEFDPRRKPGIENRYNVKQMQNYMTELNDFMRRGNQFVALRNGVAAPKGEAAVFQRRQEMAHAAQEEHDKLIGGLMTPLGQVYRATSRFIEVTVGASKYGPFTTQNWRLEDIKSIKGLRALSAMLLKQANANYLATHLEVGKRSAQKALTDLGEEDMAKAIGVMSEHQFDAFWNGTYAAEFIFAKYKEAKATEQGSSKERWQDRLTNEQFTDVAGYIDWAIAEVPNVAPEGGYDPSPTQNKKKRR